MTDNLDPVALVQGFDDAAADGHATDVFDLGTGDRLAVGHDRKRLEQRARVARFAFFPQPVDPRRAGGTGLEAPAPRNLGQLDAAIGIVLREFDECGIEVFARRPFLGEIGEHGAQALQADWGVGGHDCSFEQNFERRLFHSVRPRV